MAGEQKKIKKITKINPVKSHVMMQLQPQKRVCAYCRVSTDSREQQNSFIAQTAYYEELIGKRSDWEYAGIYADAAAIIGLNQKPEANGRRFSPFSLASAHFKANGGCNCFI